MYHPNLYYAVNDAMPFAFRYTPLNIAFAIPDLQVIVRSTFPVKTKNVR